jgi:5-formyltetrahydrofolate cyclo-ligase
MPTKTEVRRAINAIASPPPDVRGEKSARLCAAIAASAPWHRAKTVVLFAPQTREPDVEMLWGHGEGRSFAYPRVTEDRLDLFRVTSLHELRPGAWGIREPSPDLAHAVAPGEIDLILVPGVAFTRDGARLGRGGGFYDRLLSWLPRHSCKVGVCFDSQLVPELPMEPHDQSVDFVATERGIFPQP